MNPNRNQVIQYAEYSSDPLRNQQQILPNTQQQQQPILFSQVIQRNNANGCDFPADIVCPYCSRMIQTHVKYKIGVHTWIVVLLLLVLFFPLFFLPFCFLECQDKQHICPHCIQKVGYKQYKIF
ncbi:unnamed protein product [Paramecium sonneborni]|uniref:LITAF domain-containing protein n=1 Tax=Paramecium sonneborni TaxID=65129 RepID=A0A8S1QRA7_9CILI|nr:unnamed protein product [Paramecium sonneborni]